MSHTASTTTAPVPSTFSSYGDFLSGLQTHFESRSAEASARLYTTQSPGGETTLFDLFLAHVPETDRQYYTCHCCRRFVNTYGGLVTIDETGNVTSVMWGGANNHPFFAPATTALRTYTENARVNGVFLSSDHVWGTPVSRTKEGHQWTHMAVRPSPSLIYIGKVKTAEQMMAEKREDFRTMAEALAQLPLTAVNTAVALLESDALYRSEKVLGVAAWLKTLHETRNAHQRNRDNILWRAVALAPPGYCHPRASMIGTLLEDIEAGLPYEVVERRFKSKMHPLQYQRPQVAPDAGNIARAEAIVAKLGIAPSLKRRYARLDELVTIWTPQEKPALNNNREGVFAHVKAKTDLPVPAGMHLPVTTLTVEKFKRTVLPNALSIMFWVPVIKANYIALTTAEDANAPAILQWDHEDQRNPVSSYVYHGGSSPDSWGLKGGTLCKVNAVTLYPVMWYKHLPHMGEGLVMILDGARDSAWRTAGAALFPETLKAELHEVRSTIEAYSKTATISGYDESSACGLILSAKGKIGHRFRVITKETTADYELDRWD